MTPGRWTSCAILYDGRQYRVFNVLDEGNRECLAIEVDTSLPSVRLTHVLDQLIAMYGTPRRLRCDNGPEFIAGTLRDWCDTHGVLLPFIQPGKPNQNAYIERFNRSYREEILNAWIFTSLAEVRALSDEWRVMYNTERPHQSLGRSRRRRSSCQGPHPPICLTTNCVLDGEAFDSMTDNGRREILDFLLDTHLMTRAFSSVQSFFALS